jgi:2-amino-4-hydroxy-6-hydroxymethyldihydropteridine diphosphokinase
VSNPAPPPQVILALGSNLGNPAAVLLAALRRLETLAPGPLRRSRLWQTQPVACPPGSPAFVNAVVVFTARHGDTPEFLLDRLQALEREFGRQPLPTSNAPRPLDLDIIAFGTERRQTPRLVLPHPRARSRRFVLAPLAEIAPNLVLPGLTQSVAELLAALADPETARPIEDLPQDLPQPTAAVAPLASVSPSVPDPNP